MILEKAKSEIIRKGEIQENTVGIDVDNLGFVTQLLTSNLYKCPLESFLRETVANGIDSTKEAGKDLPVLIIIDCDECMNLSISIRDYGTGLSPERFDKIYKNIGSSTKRDSNDYIGALGIGRFSCLAVADQVSLVSYYNGVRYEYLMYKDNGYVNIDLIDKSDTTEENGFMVSVESNSSYYYYLNNALEDLQLLNVKIETNIEDSRINRRVNAINEKLYHEYKNFYTVEYGINNAIEMGGVIYQYGNITYNSINSNIILKCDMGSLQLTPSRESLINNEHNKQVIQEAINSANTEIFELFSKSIKSEYSVNEYFDIINNSCFTIDNNANVSCFEGGKSYWEVIQNKTFTVNGITVNESINKIIKKFYYRKFSNKDIYKAINCYFSINNIIEEGVKLFYKAENKLAKKTIDYYLCHHEKIVILNDCDIVFIEKTFNCNKEDLKTILVSLCGMMQIKNSDVPKDFISTDKKKDRSETIKIIEQSFYYTKQIDLSIRDFHSFLMKYKQFICIFIPYGDKNMVDFLKPLLISNKVKLYEIKKNIYDSIIEGNNVLKSDSVLIKRNKYFSKLIETYIIKKQFDMIPQSYICQIVNEFKNERESTLRNIESTRIEDDGIFSFYKQKSWLNEDYINYFSLSTKDIQYIREYDDLYNNRDECNNIIKKYFIKKHGLNKKIFNLK